MTYITGLTYTDILDILPKCVDYFIGAAADGETLGVNELIDSYADAHGVEFSGDARSDLAHLLRVELDKVEAYAKNL